MLNKSSVLLSILASVFLTAVSVTAMAAQGRILDRIEAEQADTEQADTAAFAAEAEIFKSIGLSIALSIAQCNSQPDCEPVVDKAELETLLDKLDDRINKLVVKQQAGGEEDYTEILTAYVTEKENFLKYQEKLDALSAPEETLAEPEEEPFAEQAPAATTTEVAPPQEAVDFSVFEDIDEALPGTGPESLAPSDELTDEPLPEE